MTLRGRHLSSLAVLASAIVIAGCGGSDSTTSSQPFAPQASLRAIGGTARTDKPELVIHVDARPGDANIRAVAVDLPPVLLVDPTALAGVCAQHALESNDCAGKRRVGSARAVSPAYDEPLAGPVYAVSGGGGSGLPRLAYVLSGPADLLLYGKVVSKGGRIQAGVEDVPDTPLKSFELRIAGGKPGYLILSRDICKADAVADGTFTGQGGQVHREKVPLEADCG
jgi:hypothetical protein